ncbi:MAG: phosphorylase, partial [Microcoleus sp. SIO2G3]|nr:phosphorylase [Microcoleus sp. SIO2G3]
AGASQRHKHLQLVPLPLVESGAKIPIEPAIASVNFQDSIGTIPSFPFVHAIAKLDFHPEKSPLASASSTLECYYNLLRAVDLISDTPVSGEKQSGAYNFLATRDWMLVVLRANECFSDISVNSLGFAGTLVVRSVQQMKLLKEKRPMTVLTSVAVPTPLETEG